ncbi:MAG: hypothetical protein WC758_04890 [Candidatus Woesearchaeota archaeon]|jgi:uncharacterized membrane protein
MSKTTDDGKICAILAYVLVGIVWFFLDKKMNKNTFAKFHVKQAIIFIIILLIANLAVALFSIISKMFGSILGAIIYTLLAIIWVVSIVYAAAGKEKGLLVFGNFARILEF